MSTPTPDPDRPDPADPDLAANFSLKRSDLALLRRAAREGWGVPDEMKAALLWKLWEKVAETDRTKVIIALTKTIDALVRTDQREDVIRQRDEALDVSRAKLALLVRESDTPSVKDALSEAERRADEYRPSHAPRPTQGPSGEVP